MTNSDLTNTYLKDLNEYSNKSTFLKSLKVEAIKNYTSLGLPTKKLDSWKYSRVENRLPKNINKNLNAETNQIPKDSWLFESAEKIVFVNGKYSKEHSSHETINYNTLRAGELTSEQLQLDHQDVFDNISLIMTEEVHEIEFKGTENKVLQIIHLDSDENRNTSTTRIKITGHKSSSAEIIETFLGTNNSTSYHYTSINLEENASLRHIKVSQNSPEVNNIGKVSATVERNATFDSFTFCLGGGLSRNQINVKLNNEGAHSEVNGLFALKNEDSSDNYSEIHHNAANTTSNQLFKGLLADHSRGIFTGRIMIHRDAQNVNANQLNKNLLLSKNARIDTRPQLEVYADDVKCAHGATIGQLNPDELFYLESRGISKSDAYEMLMHAFSEDALMKVSNQGIKTMLRNILENHFSQNTSEAKSDD